MRIDEDIDSPPIGGEAMDPIDTVDLVRVSLLSLEGVELRWQQQPSTGDNCRTRTIAVASELRAYAGFDAPDDVQISSLWCCQLLGNGGLTALESLPRNCVRAVTSDPLPLSSSVGGISWEEHGTTAPHAVVDLNCRRRSNISDISEERATDIRVCVVGSRARGIDESSLEGHEGDEFYANSGRGRVYCQAVATMRWDAPTKNSSDGICLPLTQAKNVELDSNGDGYCIELSTGASLRVRIEKTSMPRRELDKQKTDQYHYIDGKYRSSADGAPSVVDGGTIATERSKENHLLRPSLKTRLSQLLSGSSAKRVPTSNETKSRTRQNRAGPPVEEVRFSPEEFESSHLSQRPAEDYSDIIDERDDAPSSSPSTHKEMKNDTPTNRLGSARARFLCGASLGWNMADAIQIIGAAGHHCDEDHVGLYVASTEDSMGTSIGTR